MVGVNFIGALCDPPWWGRTLPLLAAAYVRFGSKAEMLTMSR